MNIAQNTFLGFSCDEGHEKNESHLNGTKISTQNALLTNYETE
jgi:hypothetical protein